MSVVHVLCMISCAHHCFEETAVQGDKSSAMIGGEITVLDSSKFVTLLCLLMIFFEVSILWELSCKPGISVY